MKVILEYLRFAGVVIIIISTWVFVYEAMSRFTENQETIQTTSNTTKEINDD